MKLLSVVTPCFNEEENVEDVYSQIKVVLSGLPDYTYEHIFIDNASTDRTVARLKKIAEQDKNVKIIVNIRNFGWMRSPFYGILQAKGEAVIFMASDLQDPPALIKEFIKKWEAGSKIVIGVKHKSDENFMMFGIRKFFYFIMSKISDTDHIKDFTGFGLYDKVFVNIMRQLNEPNPYIRGIISELGYDRAEVEFVQPKRLRGKSYGNFYRLYDTAMLGFVNQSKLPLRLASFIGFGVATISLLVAFGYFIYKLIYWEYFIVGTAPLVIGLFFFSSVQLFFIGIIGEYVGAIFTHVKKRPLVIEKERVNFD